MGERALQVASIDRVRDILEGNVRSEMFLVLPQPRVTNKGTWESNPRELPNCKDNYIYLGKEDYVKANQKYKIGNRLYVKEPWNLTLLGDYLYCFYQAGGGKKDPVIGDGFQPITFSAVGRYDWEDLLSKQGWQPASSMPKPFARIFCSIVYSRVISISELTARDLEVYGYSPRDQALGLHPLTSYQWLEKHWNSSRGQVKEMKRHGEVVGYTQYKHSPEYSAHFVEEKFFKGLPFTVYHNPYVEHVVFKVSEVLPKED